MEALQELKKFESLTGDSSKTSLTCKNFHQIWNHTIAAAKKIRRLMTCGKRVEAQRLRPERGNGLTALQ
jgi:hypothetical protein